MSNPFGDDDGAAAPSGANPFGDLTEGSSPALNPFDASAPAPDANPFDCAPHNHTEYIPPPPLPSLKQDADFGGGDGNGSPFDAAPPPMPMMPRTSAISDEEPPSYTAMLPEEGNPAVESVSFSGAEVSPTGQAERPDGLRPSEAERMADEAIAACEAAEAAEVANASAFNRPDFLAKSGDVPAPTMQALLNGLDEAALVRGLSARITGSHSSDVDGKARAYYVVRCKTNSLPEWEVQRAYSEIDTLHKDLSKRGVKMPPMPRKHMFTASDNASVVQ